MLVLADNPQRFAWGDMQLPRPTMQDPNMKLLWDHTNIIISVCVSKKARKNLSQEEEADAARSGQRQ